MSRTTISIVYFKEENSPSKNIKFVSTECPNSIYGCKEILDSLGIDLNICPENFGHDIGAEVDEGFRICDELEKLLAKKHDLWFCYVSRLL